MEHSVFGQGTVVELDMEKSAYRIKFDAMDTPRGISFRVRLEKC